MSTQFDFAMRQLWTSNMPIIFVPCVLVGENGHGHISLKVPNIDYFSTLGFRCLFLPPNTYTKKPNIKMDKLGYFELG